MKLAGIHLRSGLCFTAQIAGIVRKLDAFIALSRLRKISDDTVDKLCKFADAAQGLSERRNRVIHDVWYFDHPSPPERQEVTAKRKLRVQGIPTSTDELLQFAEDILILLDRFEDLANLVISSPNLSEGKEC